MHCDPKYDQFYTPEVDIEYINYASTHTHVTYQQYCDVQCSLHGILLFRDHLELHLVSRENLKSRIHVMMPYGLTIQFISFCQDLISMTFLKMEHPNF